ncbi:hypothetical protein D3C87_666120 [compost metagenome]
MRTNIYFLLHSILLVTYFGCRNSEKEKTSFPDYLQNTSWIIRSGGLIMQDGEKKYDLFPKDTTLIFSYYAVDFLDEKKFVSYDSWECGNDCFTTVYGRYYFTEADQIKMKIDSTSTSGTCQAPTQIFNPAKEMTFDIVHQGQQLQLIKK